MGDTSGRSGGREETGRDKDIDMQLSQVARRPGHDLGHRAQLAGTSSRDLGRTVQDISSCLAAHKGPPCRYMYNIAGFVFDVRRLLLGCTDHRELHHLKRSITNLQPEAWRVYHRSTSAGH
nr:hypothetical protein CFP56_11011 [Quercus suber]